jgi:hypothetical protein
MRKSHVGVQTDLEKKEKKFKFFKKGPDVSVMIHRGEINLFVSSRITWCIMLTSCVVVKFSQKSLADFCVALLGHAERLQDLLRPSWPDAGEIQDKMYHLVDTLMLNGVDQKWFSGYALVQGAKVMLTTPEIRAVSLGFCLSACNEVLTNRIFANTFLQAAGNVIISCVLAAHEKYKSKPLDWQQVIERGWHLLTKRDKRKFKNLCEDGLLGPGDYRIFEDWSAIDKSQDKYIRIKDGLVSEGEVQEINNKEFFFDEGPYEEHVSGYFLAYHQVVAYHHWLLFCLVELERFCEFEVSFECR